MAGVLAVIALLAVVQQLHPVQGQSTLLNLLQQREQDVETLAAKVKSLYDDSNCGQVCCKQAPSFFSPRAIFPSHVPPPSPNSHDLFNLTSSAQTRFPQ